MATTRIPFSQLWLPVLASAIVASSPAVAERTRHSGNSRPLAPRDTYLDEEPRYLGDADAYNHSGESSDSDSHHNDSPHRKQKHGDEDEKEPHSVLHVVLMYLPNRVLDLIDIVHADVGVGPAFGLAARVTRWGQVGFRSINPVSLRFGLMGRSTPILLEHDSEFGIGPLFHESRDRWIDDGEIGIGGDLFIGGLYLGIGGDQIFDFVAGVFGGDPKGDDL
jgi:hypothetical protein